MPREPGRKSVVGFFASHPVLGLVASVASIVSIPLAVFLYIEGIRTRDLKFYVSPTTTTIVKSGESSALRVLFRDQPVTTDVTGIQVAVWNAGKRPILAQDVLDPIVLKVSFPILEARVRRISRRRTHFAIDTSKESQGLVGLSWKILEHNDGAVIQLIVAGDRPPITLLGAVEGERRLSHVADHGMLSILVEAALLLLVAVVFSVSLEILSLSVHGRRQVVLVALMLAVWILLLVSVNFIVMLPKVPLSFH